MGPTKYYVTYEWINAPGQGLVMYIAKGAADAPPVKIEEAKHLEM